MIRRGAEPRALQRNSLARVMRDRDADEVFISHAAARWIEVDPAGTGNKDLDPGMSVAASSAFVVIVVIGQMQIPGYEPRGNSACAKRCYHEDGEITTTAAAEIERTDGSLDTLLVPRHVLESPPDGPRHVAQQIVNVGGAIFAEEHSAPVINRGMRRQRLHETVKAWPIFRRVGKRIDAGKILYIGCAKLGRRMVETDTADKAKLAGAVGKISDRDVIAEAIPSPGKLRRPRRNFEFRFNDLLIIVVAWTQHHPVFTECDGLIVVICRDVPDAENRHCRPMIMDAPATCIATAILSTTCIS